MKSRQEVIAYFHDLVCLTMKFRAGAQACDMIVCFADRVLVAGTGEPAAAREREAGNKTWLFISVPCLLNFN